MKLYLIEYFDTETDITDYTTVSANNQMDAIKYFVYKTHGTKIVTEINKVSGQIPQDHYESEDWLWMH